VNIRSIIAPALLVLLALITGGCASMRDAAVRDMAGSMADAAAASFATENDPALAAEAMPFALKTLDLLALQQPKNPDILLAAARAYVQYAHAFLDWEARKIEDDDPARAAELRARAANLFLRARDYAAAALALRHPHLLKRLPDQPHAALDACDASDVPALTWYGIAWASLIAANPSDMQEVARLPVVEAVMRHAYALDPDAEDGILHDFFIAFEGSRSPAAGGDPARAEAAFERAVKITRGASASPYVTLATTVAIQQQDAARFRDLLNQALAVDPDAAPHLRLANAIARDKATWYLARIDDFILSDETTTP
jgi:predicted anti-sigma-YlaC factor YlaD